MPNPEAGIAEGGAPSHRRSWAHRWSDDSLRGNWRNSFNAGGVAHHQASYQPRFPHPCGQSAAEYCEPKSRMTMAGCAWILGCSRRCEGAFEAGVTHRCGGQALSIHPRGAPKPLQQPGLPSEAGRREAGAPDPNSNPSARVSKIARSGPGRPGLRLSIVSPARCSSRCRPAGDRADASPARLASNRGGARLETGPGARRHPSRAGQAGEGFRLCRRPDGGGLLEDTASQLIQLAVVTRNRI